MSNKYKICFIETAEEIGGGQICLFDILIHLDYNLCVVSIRMTVSHGNVYQK
jgi:hypothetical protein